MKALGLPLARRWFVALASATCLIGGSLIPARSHAQQTDSVRVTQFKPRFHLLSNASGNLVVYVDDTVSLVAGTQAPALVSAAQSLLRSLKAPAVRYALMLESDSAHVFADGRWAASGATTIAHENLWVRITRRTDSLAKAGAARPEVRPPLLSFSDILQLYLPHEEPHFAHRPRGVTNSDMVIHFEGGGFAMLGNLISADEYPDLRPRRSRLNGLIDSIDWFADSLPRGKVEPIIPGRGRPLTVDDLRDYSKMLKTVMGRVDTLRLAGVSEDSAVTTKPTADFDARWGRGRISGDQFVRMVYQILSQPR